MRIASDYKMMQIVRILTAAKAAEDVEPELKALIDKYFAVIKNREEARKVIPDLVKAVEASKNSAVKELKEYYRDLLDKSVWIIGGANGKNGFAGFARFLLHDELNIAAHHHPR